MEPKSGQLFLRETRFGKTYFASRLRSFVKAASRAAPLAICLSSCHLPSFNKSFAQYPEIYFSRNLSRRRGPVSCKTYKDLRPHNHVTFAASFVPSKSYYIIFLAKDPSYTCVKCKLIILRHQMFCLLAQFLLYILFCNLKSSEILCKEVEVYSNIYTYIIINGHPLKSMFNVYHTKSSRIL